MFNDYKGETIQDIALKLVEEQLSKLQLENESKERTLLILGMKGAGKSTLINMFLNTPEHCNGNDGDKCLQPTLPLNYTYSRRSYSKESSLKKLLNIWEIYSMNNEDIIGLPLKMHNHTIKQFIAIILVDLSQSQYHILKNVKTAYQNLKDCYGNKYETQVDNGTTQANNSLPFPVVVVGGKYDLFKNNPDNVLKKEICRNLRSISQYMNAALLFYSNKMPKQVKILRDIINYLGFDTPSNACRYHQVNFEEPLCIWFGKDSWQAIDIKPIESLDDLQISIDITSDNIDHHNDEELSEEQQPSSYSGKDSLFSSIKENPFAEKEIDELCAIKKQEIEKILREISKRKVNKAAKI